MGALRKAFQESFGSIKDVLSPGGLLKSFGLLSGSPLFLLIGDKFDDLISKYKEFNAEQKRQSAMDFMKEEQRNEQIALQEKQNELLEDIRDKEFELKDDGGIADIIKKPLSFLGNIFGKKGGLLSTLGLGALGAGKGLLGKGAGLIGKAALPLAILTGGFSFIKGFKNVFDFTDKKDLKSKIDAGISQAISDFTFGLVDEKTIFKYVGWLTDKMVSIFKAPLDFLKDISEGRAISDSVSTLLSKYTFGLISEDTIDNTIDWFKDKLVDIFKSPFDLIKNLVAGEDITESISKYLSTLSFGLIPENFINNTLEWFKDKLVDIFKSPFDLIKNIIAGEDVTKSVSDFLSSLSFGLISGDIFKGLIDRFNGFIKNLFNDSVELLKGVFEDLGIDKAIEKISDVYDDVKDKFTNFKEFIGEKIKSLIELIKSPFDVVKESLSKLADKFNIGNLIPKFDDTTSADIQESAQNTKTFKIDEQTGNVEQEPKQIISDNLVPSHSTSTTMEKLYKEKLMEVRREQREKIVEKRREKSSGTTNNILNSTTNQNLVVDRDSRTKTDDIGWLRSDHF
jgi:hypothetical protein